jgi:signal transduction histidine kinase
VNPWPLKWKLSVLTFLILTSVIIVLSTVAYVEMEEALVKNIDHTLNAMSEGVLAIMDNSEGPKKIQEEIQSITGAINRKGKIRYRIWWQGRQEDVAVYDPVVNGIGPLLQTAMLGYGPAVDTSRFFNMPINSYRVLWMRHTSDQKVINIVIADANIYTGHEMAEYLRLLLILGGCVVAGSVIAFLLIISWTLNPIEQTAAILRTVTHTNLGYEHLKGLRVPSELNPFVDSVRQMLLRLNHAMQKQKQFTEDASHELRTPLALAKSTLQTVRRKDYDRQDYILAIDETLDDIDRMEKLSNQLLELARLDAAGTQMVMEKIDLNTVLENVISEYRQIAEAANKTILYEGAAKVFVHAREELLRRLFANLLDNAIKYGPADRPVHVYCQNDNDETVTICIHDEGGSIPPEALSSLFDRFYRPDSSRSSKTGGSGLGLSIAREIAHLHDGEIEILSAASTGTQVRVLLPRI